MYSRVQGEADALFANGDPNEGDFTPSTIDVTHRFLMECLRMYPIVPMSVLNVMNSTVVENYELPVGERLHVTQTSARYSELNSPTLVQAAALKGSLWASSR